MMASPLLWVVAVFAGAGRLDWGRGWFACAVYMISMGALGLIIKRVNPELIKARMKLNNPGTKSYDRIFIYVLLPLVFLQPAVAGLDAGRFHWSSMPFGLGVSGAVLFVLASALITWVMVVNPYAETTIRIQTDRGHTVVTSGPYRLVRHPMYVGTILMYVATPLLFGSVWAFTVTGMLAGLFIWRAVREDRTLRAELPGYKEYCLRTRYRLLPGVW